MKNSRIATKLGLYFTTTLLLFAITIGTIFFSQLAKLVTIASTTGFAAFDLSVLPYIIVAAIIGGFLGAQFSGLLPSKKVGTVFQFVILLVLIINVYNGIKLFL